MACEKYRDGSITIYICYPNIYHYKGFYIEENHSGYCGYSKLKKNLDPAKKEGKQFWKAVSDLISLQEEEKKRYRLN